MPASDRITESGHRTACSCAASDRPESTCSSAPPDPWSEAERTGADVILRTALGHLAGAHRQLLDTPLVDTCRRTDTHTAPRDPAPSLPSPSLSGAGPEVLPRLPDGFEWVSYSSGQAFDLRPTGSGVTLLCLHTGCHGDALGTWRVDVYGFKALAYRGPLGGALEAVREALPVCLRAHRASLRSER